VKKTNTKVRLKPNGVWGGKAWGERAFMATKEQEHSLRGTSGENAYMQSTTSHLDFKKGRNLAHLRISQKKPHGEGKEMRA